MFGVTLLFSQSCGPRDRSRSRGRSRTRSRDRRDQNLVEFRSESFDREILQDIEEILSMCKIVKVVCTCSLRRGEMMPFSGADEDDAGGVGEVKTEF